MDKKIVSGQKDINKNEEIKNKINTEKHPDETCELNMDKLDMVTGDGIPSKPIQPEYIGENQITY